MSESFEFGGQRSRLRLVAMTMTRRHPLLCACTTWAFFIGVWDLCFIPLCTIAFPRRPVTRLDKLASVVFLVASSMALGLVSCSLLCWWEAAACPSFCLLSFFHDTLVHFSSLTETWLERHKKFRLSFVTNSCIVCNLSCRRW